ncbi:MAG: hypothetical protein V7L30_05345 [Nostoc sp.]
MNSVRLDNEYWFTTVQLLETLPRSLLPRRGTSRRANAHKWRETSIEF